MIPGLLSAGASILGGLLGRQKPTEDKWITPDYASIRREAQKAGFNPLTALTTAPGGIGSASPGGLPLASIELMTGGLREVGDILSGKAAQRDARERLELDLAQLRLDQARSGVSAYLPERPVPFAGAPSVFVGRPAQVVQAAAAPVPAAYSPPSMGQEIDPLTLRPVDKSDTTDTAGVLRMQLPGLEAPVYTPGDTEPWGMDEAGTAIITAAPQIVWQRDLSDRQREALSEGWEMGAEGTNFETVVRQRRLRTPPPPRPGSNLAAARPAPVKGQDNYYAGYGGWR